MPRSAFQPGTVLQMRKAGLSMAQISAETGLPEATIRNHSDPRTTKLYDRRKSTICIEGARRVQPVLR